MFTKEAVERENAFQIVHFQSILDYAQKEHTETFNQIKAHFSILLEKLLNQAEIVMNFGRNKKIVVLKTITQKMLLKIGQEMSQKSQCVVA